MNRGGIAVDVHLYIPVVSLPEGITNDLFIPTGIPNHWHQDLAVVQQTQIDYGCLLANSTVSSGAYNPGALIPHPTMAALILCAHIFRTMLDPAFYCPFGVKLHELLEVQALIAHPNFNGDLFLKLISDFRA